MLIFPALSGPPLSGGTGDRQGGGGLLMRHLTAMASLFTLTALTAEGAAAERGTGDRQGASLAAATLDGDGIAVYSNSIDC